MSEQNNYYVNNTQLHNALKAWNEDIRSARERGEEDPEMPRFVGECVMKICDRMKFRDNFIGYSYREDMVSDAIFDCFRYAKKYDPSKYTNAFGYFSRIAWNAFLRRIDVEKEEVYTRALILNKTQMDEFLSHLEFDDDSGAAQAFGELMDEYSVMENNIPMALKRKAKKLAEKEQLEKDSVEPLSILDQCSVEDENE